MRGKTVVITGGTSGIGEVAAEILAKKGARIVLVARDQTRGDATLARLRSSAPGVAHSIYFADLTRLAEMKRVAAQIADQEHSIDVLINNAGALFARRRLTQDGLEFTFALNHMAYFVLTEGLRERLLASGPARIINPASAAHQDATLDFDDLQSAKNYRALKAYSRSKLCNILFTRELARRLHDTGVTANCLHPGFVATRFGDQSGGAIAHRQVFCDIACQGCGNNRLSRVLAGCPLYFAPDIFNSSGLIVGTRKFVLRQPCLVCGVMDNGIFGTAKGRGGCSAGVTLKAPEQSPSSSSHACRSALRTDALGATAS